VGKFRRREPFIEELFHPVRNRYGSNVTPFSDEVHDCPMIFTTLKVIESEVGQLPPSKTTTEQDGNNRGVSLAFERFSVGGSPQSARIARGQPISEPCTEFLCTLSATYTSSQFRAE